MMSAAIGCSTAPALPDHASSQEENLPGITPTRPAHQATATTAPAIPPTATATAAPAPTDTPVPALERCSPLGGLTLESLPELITNPFLPPAAGSDDPHQGIDLADLDAATRISLEGRPVLAVFGGRVSAVVTDRFPYGNAIIVETKLERLPPAWVTALSLPTPGPIQVGHPVLTCPTAAAPPDWEPEQRSLYLIYAHLQSAPFPQPGDQVDCGEQLGAVGMSGNALNPHLHLEARVGPAGASFPGMAHYTGDASPEELRSYCQWRVSGAFQLLDPLPLLVSP